MYRFQARLLRTGILRAVNIPPEISRALGGKTHLPVRGTIAGVPFESTLLPRGGEAHRLIVHSRIWRKLKLDEGAMLDIKIELDPDYKIVNLPPELESELVEGSKEEKVWRNLTPALKREISNYLFAAKSPETRAKRVRELLQRLRRGMIRASKNPQK